MSYYAPKNLRRRGFQWSTTLPCGHTIKSWRECPTRDGLCPMCDIKRRRRDQLRKGRGK